MIKTKESSYVVVRNGIRVSDVEYRSDVDAAAKNELAYWKKLVTDWPDGSIVEIVKKDNKKHRIYNL